MTNLDNRNNTQNRPLCHADLTRMNVYKLNKLSKDIWGEIAYKEYVDLSVATKILDCQAKKVSTERKVDVINTALFIALDHFGNQEGFYDSLIIGVESGTEQILQPV